MKHSRKIVVILALCISVQALSAVPRLVDNTIGTRLGKIFPELRDGYIDLNQNGSLDQLEDMDELVPESRLRDNILQVQEIFDFLIQNYRYLPLSKLTAVRDALDDPQGAIPQILTINYRTAISKLISEREAMGDEGLYLSPSARRKALATMQDLISRLSVAYQKEWQRAESDFVSARKELFSLLAKGYPIPEKLLPEDYSIFESTLINAVLPDRGESPEDTRTAIYTLGKIKSENAVPYLMKLLGNDQFSRDAIRALGSIGTPDAKSLILARLENEQTGKPERMECIRALGKIGGTESSQALIGMLKNEDTPPDQETERELVNALSDMASKGYTDRKIASILTDYLHNDNPDLRTIAVRGLSYYSDQASAAQVLDTLKNDRNEAVTLAAVRSIHRVNHPSTVPTLMAMLKTGNLSPKIDEEIIKAMGEHPDGLRGTVSVLDYLGNPEPGLRAAAKKSLRKLYDQNPTTVTGALARGVAASKDELYQKEGTALMAELADPASINTFAALLSSPSPEVRKNVTWGLYRIGVAGNLRVETALQKLVTSETEPLEVRINSLRALARAGEDHPSMQLWQTFATTARMRGEKYAALRRYALQGLGSLGTVNDEILSVLTLVARGEKDRILRKEAVKALHMLGTTDSSVEGALADIAGGTKEPAMDVRLEALQALGDMGSSETGSAARGILDQDLDPALKRSLVYSLVRAGNEDSYEVLFDLCADKDVQEFLVPFLEEADPAVLKPLIDRRLKREESDEIRSVLESVLNGFARGL